MDDATTNRRCVHAPTNPPPAARLQAPHGIRCWRQYGAGTAGRSASWSGCRTCFARFLRHRSPNDISRGWPGQARVNLSPSPLRDVCVSPNTPERCDGPSEKGNPAKGHVFALARKTRVEMGKGVRGGGGGGRTVDAARVPWIGPVRLPGGRGDGGISSR